MTPHKASGNFSVSNLQIIENISISSKIIWLWLQINNSDWKTFFSIINNLMTFTRSSQNKARSATVVDQVHMVAETMYTNIQKYIHVEEEAKNMKIVRKLHKHKFSLWTHANV